MQPILLLGCSVRLAITDDRKAIASLLSECFSRAYPIVYQEWCDRNVQPNSLTLIAIIGSAIVGVLELSVIDNNSIYLSSLAVDPNFRNQGIATKLLSEAQAIAQRLGISHLYLHVLPVEKTLRLYLKAGYQFHCVQSVANQITILLRKKLHQ